MGNKADRFNTPKIPRGFGRGREVTAAGGGRVIVGNQLAKEERQALWLDPDTGEWREFSEVVPHFDPHAFRTPAYDSIFETSLWSVMRRQPVQTYKGLDWTGCRFEDFLVVISLLASDKPLESVAAAPKPKLPPPQSVTISVKEAAPALKPKEWWAEIRKKPLRRKSETPGEYARRLHTLMQSANVTKVWSFETLLRRLYDK